MDDDLLANERAKRQAKREARRASKMPRGKQVTEQDLIQAHDNIHDENTQALDNSIQKLVESQQIGANTLVTLAMQREQMLRVDDDLDAINNCLTRCERHIKGISSLGGAFSNAFSKPAKESFNPFRRRSSSAANPKAADADTKADPAADPELNLPASVSKADECKKNKIESLLADKSIKLGRTEEGAKNVTETVLYHYHNTSKPSMLAGNITDKCIVVTNMRFIHILDGKVASQLFLPDIEHVSREEKGALKYDELLIRYNHNSGKSSSGANELRPSSNNNSSSFATVPIWGGLVSTFFCNLLQVMTADVKKRREERAATEKKIDHGGRQRFTTKPQGMSDLEWKFEQSKDKEDQQLDTLSNLLDGTLQLSKDIGKELAGQSEIIDHLGDKVASTDLRIEGNNKKMDKVLKGKAGRW